jgi:hypothetical protein
MSEGNTRPEEVLSHLTVEDLMRLRELLTSGIHDLSPGQVATLRSLLDLYSEYNIELKTLVEEKKIGIMWAKVRLQTVLVIKWVLYFVLAIFAAIQTVDAASGVIRKWWSA